ncbi:glycosyl transferase family 1 [Aphanothece hegewaldii CCALA 016]|uniref:Glycosyl transferase family 1 n=1 Tax=Aphanothece hegewaldii CCALA 016 TaxID=2107694 RepID=A0A2T1M217_9CHRO|nr:glycosyltransferase [Aphanothece hegewaldii]PSF38675.1 glycosyl transferase family 1 [Aphanothece hegewaldii CCALA 016]
MKKIGIYRRVFPLVSETFISQQAEHLQRFEPTFISSTLVAQSRFASVSLCKNDFFKLKQLTYLLTRSPYLFSNLELLNKLSLIHAHFGIDGVYAMALAEKLKIPFLVTFHGYDITISRQSLWKTGKFLYYQLIFYEEQLKKQASAFIAVSSFIRDKLIEKGYSADKIYLHHIGVDTVRFSPTNTKADERYILCVGRHTEKKGIDTLLRAFALIARKHPNVTLIQVGKGSMTAYLHTLAKKLGISDRVRFLGAQKHDTVFKLMQNAEIFVLPSQTASNGDCEGLPIVINEASACGIPVVSTWHSGIPEAVKDGETGFLVAEKDSQSLACKMDILLSDRALAKKLGLRGREWMCDAFDIRQQTSKLEGIYDSFH